MENNSEAIIPFVNWLESKDALFIYMITLLTYKIKLKENHHKITPKIFTKEGTKKYIIDGLLSNCDSYTLNNEKYIKNFIHPYESDFGDDEDELSNTLCKLRKEWIDYVEENLYNANAITDSMNEFKIFLERYDCLENFIVNFVYSHLSSDFFGSRDNIRNGVINGTITYDSVINSDVFSDFKNLIMENNSGILSHAFSWGHTPEGYRYWADRNKLFLKHFYKKPNLRWK